jgi:hypothetical protein
LVAIIPLFNASGWFVPNSTSPTPLRLEAGAIGGRDSEGMWGGQVGEERAFSSARKREAKTSNRGSEAGRPKARQQ